MDFEKLRAWWAHRQGFDGSMHGDDRASILENQAILDRSRLVGLWDYDPERQEIVWASIDTPSEALQRVVAETEAFIRDQLGDTRSFSLDSPTSRKPSFQSLREISTAVGV